MDIVTKEGFMLGLQQGVVGDKLKVVSTHLGNHQQLYYMAKAACDFLGADMYNISAQDITVALAPLKGLQSMLADVQKKWPPFNSAHEGYAVLLEEVDELWEEVKLNQKNRDLEKMKEESLQVACCALRFYRDVCTEKGIRK